MLIRSIAVFSAVLLAAACAPAPSTGESGTPAPRQDRPEETLVTSLSVQPARDTVRLTLQVTNAAAVPVTLSFTSGQTYDFAVERGGETLWRWSADRSFMQALRDETLAPGETRTYTEAWHPGAATAGEFIARGWLTSSSHPVERTAAFHLP